MEINVKTVAIASISTIVAVLLCTTVLIPVVSEASSDSTSVEQNVGYLGRFTSMDTFTLTDDTNGLLLNGEPINSTVATRAVYVVLTDGFIAVSYMATAYWIYFYCDESGAHRVDSDPRDPTTLVTVSVNGKYAEITRNNTVLFSKTLEVIRVCCDQGEYANVSIASSPIVSNNDIIVGVEILASNYGVYYGTYGNLDTAFHATDSVVDTNTYNPLVGGSLSTFGDSELYQISSANASLIVPYEYVYLTQKDGAVYDIVQLIPLMVLAGLVIGVVGIFIRSRD